MVACAKDAGRGKLTYRVEGVRDLELTLEQGRGRARNQRQHDEFEFFLGHAQ